MASLELLKEGAPFCDMSIGMSDAIIISIMCARRIASQGMPGIPTFRRRSPYDLPTASLRDVLC
ncbi:MAG: hypothetical protein ACRYHA_31395 [Janthinobacterium lividum]